MNITQRTFILNCELKLIDIMRILDISYVKSRSIFNEIKLLDQEQFKKLFKNSKTTIYDEFSGKIDELYFIIQSNFRVNNRNMKPILVSLSGIMLYWNKPAQNAVIMQDKEVLDVWESVGVRPITAQKRFKALYK